MLKKPFRAAELSHVTEYFHSLSASKMLIDAGLTSQRAAVLLHRFKTAAAVFTSCFQNLFFLKITAVSTFLFQYSSVYKYLEATQRTERSHLDML